MRNARPEKQIIFRWEMIISWQQPILSHKAGGNCCPPIFSPSPSKILSLILVQ